jgi:hypothetical protein
MGYSEMKERLWVRKKALNGKAFLGYFRLFILLFFISFKLIWAVSHHVSCKFENAVL